MEEPDRYFFRFRPGSWKLSGDRHDRDCQENFIHLTFAEVGCLAVRFDFVVDTGNFSVIITSSDISSCRSHLTQHPITFWVSFHANLAVQP